MPYNMHHLPSPNSPRHLKSHRGVTLCGLLTAAGSATSVSIIPLRLRYIYTGCVSRPFELFFLGLSSSICQQHGKCDFPNGDRMEDLIGDLCSIDLPGVCGIEIAVQCWSASPVCSRKGSNNRTRLPQIMDHVRCTA